MSTNELQARLDGLRAKRKPPLTDAELRARAEEEALLAAIADELRALRAEENEDIIKKHAPNAKTRRFFDFDPDGVQPATIEHGGATCTLYTRFVVRGADADQMDRISDAITAKPRKDGDVDFSIDTAKITAITAECAEECVVYPMAASVGVSLEQHKANIKASLWYLGAARAALGAAAKEIGEGAAKAHLSKS